jgi:predicted Zn-dependent protease
MGALGRDRFLEVSAPALEIPGVDGAEVLLLHEWGGLTRFAGSEIHQSTASEDTSLRVRVVSEARIGVAATNDCTRAGALAAAERAAAMAAVATPDPLWPGLAPPADTAPSGRFDDATAECTPEARAESVAALVGRCAPGFTAAGAYETRAVEVALANTEGQVCWEPFTQASMSTVITGGDRGSGYAEVVARRADDLDPSAVGARAMDTAARSQRPTELEPGTYPVVLEPAAVSTITGFLSWIGFAGRSYVEGRSCLSGKTGRAVAAPGVSVWDDGSARDMPGVGFDFEGVPKRRVDLIRDGVFLDAVYDLRTARQAGREDGSTGHGLPSPNPEGPFPMHLVMAPGDSSLDEMIAATDRGLLISRFHYANVVNPMDSSITGMTRDGTFLIEHGQVTRPVRNFRFTQSLLGALADVSMIGHETELASEFFYSASRVPALKVEAFHFSGVSDH